MSLHRGLINFATFENIHVDQNKTLFEIFSSNFKNIDQDEIKNVILNKKTQSKSAIHAQKHREIGDDFFKQRIYIEALNYYYLSLQNAPQDSLEYLQALADRSKAHFALKNYKVYVLIYDAEALIDIERILSFPTFPQEMLSKIYIRQSQCFLHFKQYFETLNSCDLAYKNLRKFKNVMDAEQHEIRHNFLNGVVNKVDEMINVKDEKIIELEYPKPLLKDGENPKFMSASNTVEIKYNERKGRHVVAKTNIKPGDILFVEEPYCAVRNDDFLFCLRYCSHCFVFSETTIPCKHCLVHFYCTEHCRQTAWDNEHRWICYGEMNNLLGDAMRITLIVTFKACFTNFNTTIEDENVYGNRQDNFPYVHKLVSNSNKFTNEEIGRFTKLAIWLVIYLKECTDFFIWLHERPAFADKKLPELYDFIGGYLLQFTMQIHCNCDEIIDTTIDLQEQRLENNNIGFGLYVSTALMNHSCVPNTQSTFDQNLKVVRAIKKIPKNTEITTDYLSLYKCKTHEEKEFFRKNYKFSCTCAKCASPLKHERQPWLCSKCHGKAFNVTETQAKCVNCHVIFNTKGYKNIEDSLAVMLQCTNFSLKTIDNINKKMKKIYHKDNIWFVTQLNTVLDYYSKEANVDKCIKICKELVQLTDKYKDIDELKLHAYLKLLRSTGIKCFFMRLQLLPQDNISDNEFQDVKEKCLDLLKYFVSNKHIKKYKKYIHDYLDPNELY